MDMKSKFKFRSFIRSGSSSSPSSSGTHIEDRKNSLADLKSPNSSYSSSQFGSNQNIVEESQSVTNYIKEKEIRESHSLSPLNNPDVAQEILNSIDKVYFTNIQDENAFNVKGEILDKLPEVLDLGYLSREQERLRSQLVIVTKKVSQLILKNQTAYAEELERVTQLQDSLSDAIKICTKGRTYLHQTNQQFICATLGIVASYRRREVLKELLKSLQTIKTLQETDIRLRELLDEDEDYSGAIQLYLECNKVVESLKHYKCISELGAKLQDTLEMTEEQIDVALSKMCVAFNEALYVKLQNAYQLLGKTQTAMDQQLMHFASAIHNKAFSVVLGYVELFACGEEKSEKFHKKQYSELCRFLTNDCYIPCLTDLCKALWDIMVNYFRILRWHQSDQVCDNVNEMTISDDQSEETTTTTSEQDTCFDKRYVKQKLEHGLIRVWQDVQQKVRVLIQNHDLSGYNFEEFISILSIAEKMIDIGEEFCGNKSEELQETLRIQTVNYFQNYHQGCMYELKMFLDNETWTLCPVTTHFQLSDLQEFFFLKSSHHHKPVISPNSSPTKQRSLSSFYFSNSFIPHSTSDLLISPFDDCVDQLEGSNEQENIFRDLNQEGEEQHSTEQKRKISSEENDRMLNGLGNSATLGDNSPQSGPIMTTTTLNVLRLLGKYMHTMDILRSIAFDVLLCMFHLFDYYMFAIYKFFGKEMSLMADNSMSVPLKASLKRISDHLIDDSITDAKDMMNNRYQSPSLSSVVQMTDHERLFGLAERIVAVESLVVLSKQFQFLHQHLDALIPTEKKPILQQYFDQVVSVAPTLRNPVYLWVAVKCIPYDHVLSLMAQTKWDIKEILSMHNSYVDLILRELQSFSVRLNDVCATQLMGINIPKDAHNMLWENVLRLTNRTFIEGFSQAKKCTHEGRALMQLDYQQFLTKVEQMTSVRPVPECDLVSEYIKAYYLPESALIDWIKKRKEYNQKQLISLVKSMTPENKKLRARLVNVIEDEFANK